MNYDVLYGLAFCIYVIVTVIMWRNVDMLPFFKASFCLFVVPIFFFGMAANLWLFDTLYPLMFVMHDNEPPGRQSGGGFIAFILAMPLAFAMSYGWYRFMSSFKTD